MKSLFIYHWLFRILSPIFSGIAIYALILLTYGDLDSLFESAQTPELYLCIGLALIVQELTIFLLRRINKQLFIDFNPAKIAMASGRVLLLGLIATSFGLSFYYQFFLGYLPAQEEIILFNTLYAILLILYITTYLSNGILDTMAQNRINGQQAIKRASEEDFNRFIKDINPALLTSSLEAVISHLHLNEDKADEITILLSKVYRYLITQRKNQLVNISQEVDASLDLIALYNSLPHRKAELSTNISDGHIIPGTLISILEDILKCVIPSTEISLLIEILEEEGFIYISYETFDKLDSKVCEHELQELKNQYSRYTDRTINISSLQGRRRISIPKLIVSA